MKLKVLTFLLILSSITLNSQVEVPKFGVIKYLKGYSSEISGQNIAYRSVFSNEANLMALLTRCNNSTGPIEWLTESIPSDTKDEYVYFAFMGAHAQGTLHGDRKFDFFVNDNKIFKLETFLNNRDSDWYYEAPTGEAIYFLKKRKDAADDNHGFFYLRLPADAYPKGKPVKLGIAGQKEDSPDWMMVFKFMFEEQISLTPASVLSKDNMQPIEVKVIHFGEKTPLKVTVNQTEQYSFLLQEGQNVFEIYRTPVEKPTNIVIHAEAENKLDTTFTLIHNPVIHRDIFLIHHSHYDIGYSDLQEKVERQHNKNISDALRYIDRTKDNPYESRYRWNIETANAVENYSKVCTKQQWEQLIKAIKNGYIDVGAIYANISSGICSPEEMFKVTSYSQKFAKRYGLSIETAMMGDIPGLVWGYLPALARTGVKYFSDGPNYMATPETDGDRIGWSSVSWKDQPFWWESPSGKERILFWLAGKGYSSWHGLKSGEIFDVGLKRISEYMTELNKKNYPYSMVQWRYNIVADNGPTDSLVADFVKSWNEKYSSPKIILSTVTEMFKIFEQKYGSKLPVVKGDFTPYWEDGAYSTTAEMVMNNRSSAAITNLTTLYAIKDIKQFPLKMFEDAWKNILLFDEHTWGAYNSTSDPDFPEVKEQWRYKRNYALYADSLLTEIKKPLFDIPQKTTQIDVYNTASWDRSEIIYLPKNISKNIKKVKDKQGKEMMIQYLNDGRLAVLVENIPPLGAKRFVFEKGTPVKPVYKAQIKNIIQNKLFKIIINEKTGSIKSLKSLPDNTELVSTLEFGGLNEYRYVAGLDPKYSKSATVKKISIIESGSLLISCLVEGDAPGCRSYSSKITLNNPENTIEISNTLDKIAIREKEAVHFAFPFKISNSTNRFNTGWNGIFGPEYNQLKGSNQDFYCVQQWCDVSNEKNGITMLLKDANLIEQGSMVDETLNKYGKKTWKKIPTPGATLFSYALNNYWHTNFKADQEGLINIRYTLIPHRKFDIFNTQRRGHEYYNPLLVLPASDKSVSQQLFTLSSDAVIVSSVEPIEKGLKIRMFNISDANISFNFNWISINPAKMFLAIGYSNKKELKPTDSIRIAPLGIVEVVIPN